MKKNLSIVILLISLAISQSVFSQTYSFEKGKVPEGWKIDKGVLHISSEKYKSGSRSLQIKWKQNAVLTIPSPTGISEACRNRNGGMNAWIYLPPKRIYCFPSEMRLVKKYANFPSYLTLKVGDVFGLNFKET